MGDRSRIEWCDATWNPIIGCSRVSAGCMNCYAERTVTRFQAQLGGGLVEAGPHGPRWTGKVAFIESRLDQPLRWKRPRRIFVNSLSDLFHSHVPDEVIDRVFAVMALAHWHTFIVLTKRPERMKRYFEGLDEPGGEGLRDAMIEGEAQALHAKRTGEDPSLWLAVHMPLPNVWLGVSAEDQATAEERIPLLLATPAVVHVLSAEPLLGPIDLRAIYSPCCCEDRADRCDPISCVRHGISGLEWVIAGGESGPKARPAHPDWFRSLRDQCVAAGVPFHFKQHGDWGPADKAKRPDWGEWLDADLELGRAQVVNGLMMRRLGKKAAGRELDGRTWDEVPGAAP